MEVASYFKKSILTLTHASKRVALWHSVVVIVIFTILATSWYVLFVPIAPFTENALVTIPRDASVAETAQVLVDEHVLRSAFVFKVVTKVFRLDRSLQPGVYFFQKPIGALPLALRIYDGETGIKTARITFTEGMTRYDMSDTLTHDLPGFSSQVFLRNASTSEGYLFPDTYFLTPGTTPDEIISRLHARFEEQIETIAPEVQAFGMTQSDIVIMASLLEREARDEEDKRMVAGILWNRIRIGMPLQVDAVFGYIHKANGYTPTATDLASNSPYNTYRNKGLPPGPICNPGLESLLAAVTPTQTKNLYYLTGKDGLMHYAKTFEEHKKNRALYLD